MKRILRSATQYLATPGGFLLSQGSAVLFGMSGVAFGFSERWQVLYTLYLSIVTFLIGGIIVVGQSHSEESVHKKLDEMIRVEPKARNELIGIENKTP